MSLVIFELYPTPSSIIPLCDGIDFLLIPFSAGKSSVLLDVKPWDDETDMKKLEESVRSVQMEGLLWGACMLFLCRSSFFFFAMVIDICTFLDFVNCFNDQSL